jgi:hypothetical protein
MAVYTNLKEKRRWESIRAALKASDSTAEEIAGATGIPLRTVRRHLPRYVGEGILRASESKNTHYGKRPAVYSLADAQVNDAQIESTPKVGGGQPYAKCPRPLSVTGESMNVPSCNGIQVEGTTLESPTCNTINIDINTDIKNNGNRKVAVAVANFDIERVLPLDTPAIAGLIEPEPDEEPDDPLVIRKTILIPGNAEPSVMRSSQLPVVPPDGRRLWFDTEEALLKFLQSDRMASNLRQESDKAITTLCHDGTWAVDVFQTPIKNVAEMFGTFCNGDLIDPSLVEETEGRYRTLRTECISALPECACQKAYLAHAVDTRDCSLTLGSTCEHPDCPVAQAEKDALALRSQSNGVCEGWNPVTAYEKEIRREQAMAQNSMKNPLRDGDTLSRSDYEDVAGAWYLTKARKYGLPSCNCGAIVHYGIERGPKFQNPAPIISIASRCSACIGVGFSVRPGVTNWLWPSRIPFGRLTLLAGHPGVGKGMATMYIAAAASTGTGWFDCKNTNGPLEVVIASSEDAIADTLTPRLMAAGADLSKVMFLDGVSTDKGDKEFTLDTDLPALREMTVSYPNAKLIIIDPVLDYLQGKSEMNAKALFSALDRIAEETRAAIVLVTHYTKTAGKSNSITRGNAMGLVDAVHVAWSFGMDRTDGLMKMLPLKAPCGGGLTYQIVPKKLEIDGKFKDEGFLRWEGVTGCNSVLKVRMK